MSEQTALRQRSEIEEQYKWRLTDLYQTDAAWEADFAALKGRLPRLAALEKSITGSARALADGLRELDEASLLMERLYVYARMRRDEDNRAAAYQALADRAAGLSVEFAAATAYLRPLLLSVDEAVLRGYMEDAGLADYRFMLEDLLRGKRHVLAAPEERLLSLAGDFAGGPRDIFTMLNNADLRFGSVEHDGKKIPLTHGSYLALLQSPDRALREKAYRAYYAAYRGQINTIAATYAASVKKDVFYARARGYESALAAALFPDAVPQAVYDGLIGSIRRNLPVLHRYVAHKARVLGLPGLRMYDIFAPLSPEAKNEFSYEQAKELVRAALAPLGKDYLELLDEAFAGGWIDVCESEGKSSGAYSWGAYGTHPYVLLNHRGDLDSVFTLAHELGHALHTYYSNTAQPYATSGYAIFAAEVASTVNEILLTKYLLRTVRDPALKKSVLCHYVDQFRTTVVRQTMFAEFEKTVHEMAERGEALTPESLCRTYGELNALYHGAQMETDEDICCEWARIPHFYTAFYVYKYATGFSCASAIVAGLERPGGLERYRAFLLSGGSDYPIALLEAAGVDFSRAVDDCMAEFSRALAQLEAME